MQVWNLLHAAHWKHRTQKSRQKSPSRHHRTTLSGYIFSTEAHIDNWKKKLVKQQYVLHMSPQYGELRPTSGWDRLTSLGYPSKFQLISRLGSVSPRHLVVGVTQTFRRWTEGATCIRQGDHHVGHWPTSLVLSTLVLVQCLCMIVSLLSHVMAVCGCVENKSDADWIKRCTEIEVAGVRQRRHDRIILKGMWKVFGLFWEDELFRICGKEKPRNSWLTQCYAENAVTLSDCCSQFQGHLYICMCENCHFLK